MMPHFMVQAIPIIESCLDYTPSRRSKASEVSERVWIRSGFASDLKPVEIKQKVSAGFFKGCSRMSQMFNWVTQTQEQS
jgi:hypothetical protein